VGPQASIDHATTLIDCAAHRPNDPPGNRAAHQWIYAEGRGRKQFSFEKKEPKNF
jgi:hypothetical protein